MIKLTHIKWNPRQGPAANARRELPLLAAEFFGQVRAALTAAPDPVQLHRIRLAAKQIRYTLELFRPCYGNALESRIDALRSLQQILGEINDCAVTLRLLASVARPSPQREKVARHLSARLRKKTAELHHKWTADIGTPQQEVLWIRYLSKGAKQPARARS